MTLLRVQQIFHLWSPLWLSPVTEISCFSGSEAVISAFNLNWQFLPSVCFLASLSCLRIEKFKYECQSLTVFLQVCFAESSSQACLWQQYPCGLPDLWFYGIVHWPAGNTHLNSKFKNSLTLKEISAPAELWLRKIKVSTFVLVSCFWHQCLLNLIFWFGPLLVCYWADCGFPWNAWVGNVSDQELSAGIEQLAWALAFLSVCLTQDVVCRHRYCSPGCAVGEIWEVCSMWDVWNIELPLFIAYFTGGKNWFFFWFSP